jgi:hypothetical protein
VVPIMEAVKNITGIILLLKSITLFIQTGLVGYLWPEYKMNGVGFLAVDFICVSHKFHVVDSILIAN